VLRSLNHPNVLQFMGVLYKDKKLNLVTGKNNTVIMTYLYKSIHCQIHNFCYFMLAKAKLSIMS